MALRPGQSGPFSKGSGRKTMREKRWEKGIDQGEDPDVTPGIVIMDRGSDVGKMRPRITAFIWGGKVRPTPTLPFGRWKGAA